MQYSDEKDQLIRELENENRKLQEKVKSLERNVEVLTKAVLHAAKQRFGASSEKTPEIYGQCFLFGELIDKISDESENKVINIKEHKRPVRKKGDMEKLIRSLPHELVECVLNEDAMCKICGSELEIMGKEKVRSEMEYIPAKLVIKDYVQYVYKCVECRKMTLIHMILYPVCQHLRLCLRTHLHRLQLWHG